MGWEEILGTLAGENTIFALARTAEEGSRIASRLQGGAVAESEEAT